MEIDKAIHCFKSELEQYEKQYPEASKNHPLCAAMRTAIAALERQEEYKELEADRNKWKARAEEEADTISIIQNTFKDGMIFAKR